MAWTTPIDWSDASDVPSGIVTAAMLNANVRENLNALSGHAHSGSAGDGASTLTGVTLTTPTFTDIVTFTFANQSANPDAAGELQRNGNDLLWYGSSVANLSAADASAGTASLRSLGTTSVKAAAGNHSHNPGAEVDQATTEVVDLEMDTTDSNDVHHSGEQDLTATTESGNLLSRTFTTTATDLVWVVAYALVLGEDNTVDDSFLDARLYLDGSLVDTANILTTWTNVLMTASVEKTADEYTAQLRIYNSNGANAWYKFVSMGLLMGSVKGKAIP